MNIIVTGASRGIGYELVKALVADDSVTNVFAVSRNKESLERLAGECGAKVHAVAADISADSFAATYKEEIGSKVDAIDIVVNNAGYLVNKPFEELTREDIHKVYNVNVFAIFSLVQLALPQLQRSDRPHIVNISSIGGFQGSAKFPGLSAYSSSKAALVGLTECLAEEFKGKGIAVNCLALGAVQTEMLAQAFPGYKAPLQPAEMAAYIKDFSLSGHHVYNGKILPVSLSTP